MTTIIMCLVLAAALAVPIGIYLKTRSKPLNPRQQVYADAMNLILTHGLKQHSFTDRGKRIGEPGPHCILAAVVASDPDFNPRQGIYALPSNVFLRDFSYNHLGMYPEDVNDKLGIDAVLDLLEDAIKAAR